jgi:hypothetical protein
MSKKQAKSDREIDLPDWADDVTPTDEVMKKFYAPTGTFQRGPIPVRGTDTPLTPVANEPDISGAGSAPREPARIATNQEEASAAAARTIAQQGHQAEQIEELPASQIPPFKTQEQPQEIESSLLSPVAERQDSSRLKPAVDFTPALPESVQGIPEDFPALSQPVSFEEFVKKWKRYLYPGQLAVMRTLFEQTIERGTSECFIRYSEVASHTKMTRRNCINVMNSLVERGFVERLEVRNDAISKGIKLRVYPDPLL